MGKSATSSPAGENGLSQARAVLHHLSGSLPMDNYIDTVAADVRASIPRDRLPADGHDLAALFRLYALVARIKGEQATAADVHDAWSVWMLNRGEAHEAIRPYEDLDDPRGGQPVIAAVRSAAKRARSRHR
jgi:hypothetical protein